MPTQPPARSFLPISLFILFLTLSGCTALGPGHEPPTVSVSSFRAIPGPDAVPRFEIGLHIINPNRTALNLKGVAYTITVEGHKILTGVANDLPQIEAYGQGEVLLQAGVDLFSSILFFTDLAGKKDLRELTYSLDAKLDVGALYPVIRVNRKGTFKLGPGL